MSEEEPVAVAVLGAGRMGSGIAKLMVQAGYAVHIFDADVLTSQNTAKSLEHLGNVYAALSVEQAVQETQLIFEAVAEDLEIKRVLLSEVERHNKTAPIASNTSTFMPRVLSEGLSDPTRLLIAHFFNPAEIVPLVEVVESERTRRSATLSVIRVLERAGKVPVLLGMEAPGFVGNRLQAAVFREALAIVRQGIATFEQVDQVMTNSLGPRWSAVGPFVTADLGGLDVFTALADQLFPVLDDADRAPRELRDRVAQGDLGAKTGRGFYEYPVDRVAQLHDAVRGAFPSTSAAPKAGK